MKIKLESVSKAYGDVPALVDLSLEMEAGQIIVVLGPNGAGKSTLLHCLHGGASLDRGTIQYDGVVFSRDRMDIRKKIYFLPDYPPIFPHWSPLKHIGMVLRLYETMPAGIEDRVFELFRDLDLFPLASRPLSTLSRGQLYKSLLAGLIAVDPEVWLLDEPFASGMDPLGFNVLKRYAREAVQRGHTVIYSTQILELAESFSDKAIVLNGGKLYAFDSVKNLLGQTDPANASLEPLFNQLRTETAK